MPISRKENDAWLIFLGETQERLDLIHAGADAMRARLDAEGRGPSAVFPEVSDSTDVEDDEEFEEIRRLITPPRTPRAVGSARGGGLLGK